MLSTFFLVSFFFFGIYDYVFFFFAFLRPEEKRASRQDVAAADRVYSSLDAKSEILSARERREPLKEKASHWTLFWGLGDFHRYGTERKT